MPGATGGNRATVAITDGSMDSDDDIARANRAKRGSPFLNTEQAAAYLKISARLLKSLRVKGEGPVFRRHCRFVQYHIDDLNAWSREQSAKGIRR